MTIKDLKSCIEHYPDNTEIIVVNGDKALYVRSLGQGHLHVGGQISGEGQMGDREIYYMPAASVFIIGVAEKP